MTLVYRSTVGRRLTVSEGDLNIYQLSQSDGVTFVQSGTGALPETTQDALRRLVALSQYATSGNYDTAKAALSTSEKMAIGGALEFMSNVASTVKTVWRVPNINTSHGDFAMHVTSGVLEEFNSNTNWQLGYNPGHEMAGVPSLAFSFESDFDNGAGPGVEWHLAAHSPAGTAFRPLSIRIEDSTSFTDFSFRIDKINFFDRTNVNQFLQFFNVTTTSAEIQFQNIASFLTIMTAGSLFHVKPTTAGITGYDWISSAGAQLGYLANIGADSFLNASSGNMNITASAGNVILSPSGDIKWGKALVALGGGAAPTFGTIGGSGPATAGQNGWLRLLDSAGAACWVPVWK